MTQTSTPVFTHIAIQTPDMDATIAFYKEYCGLSVVHTRSNDETGFRVVWMGTPEKKDEFVFVLMTGESPAPQATRDYSHLGFALPSKAEVDLVASRARDQGCLAWEPVEEPWPVGYYCGVFNPDRQVVEFSYGQPIGDFDPSRN